MPPARKTGVFAMSLNAKSVLVIGGSSGIGLAAARLAAEAGARVTIASRTEARIARALEALPGVAGQPLDVTDAAAVEAFFAGGPVWDHVIVTGSEVEIAAVRDHPLDKAQAAFGSKFWGFYNVARHARIADGGSISVVSGFLARRPAAGRALMGAINGALESLVQGLALELKPVRVNAVSPAMVDTEMWHGMPEEQRRATLARVGASYPAGTVGQPDDIARMLLLLVDTPYATGSIVTLDGGASIA
jgi:NAD(P)-dependent dehydrogenase (short-subunit alcohol dehydrogenase family)